MTDTVTRVQTLLRTHQSVKLPQGRLRGNVHDVECMSLVTLGAVIGILAAAALVYWSQPDETDYS